MTDEDSKTIELNRRRVLGGIITVGGAAAAAGAGTFAAFSDSESSDGNSITAGTLNLELNTNNSGANTSLNVSGLVPGDTGYLAIELENTGSVNANFTDVYIGDVGADGSTSAQLTSDSEGTDGEFTDDGSGSELDDYLEVQAFIEASSDFTDSVGTAEGSTVTPSTNQADVVGNFNTLVNVLGSNSVDGTESLNSGSTKYFVLNYELPQGTGNTVQGDGIGFDVQINIEQA